MDTYYPLPKEVRHLAGVIVRLPWSFLQVTGKLQISENYYNAAAVQFSGTTGVLIEVVGESLLPRFLDHHENSKTEIGLDQFSRKPIYFKFGAELQHLINNQTGILSDLSKNLQTFIGRTMHEGYIGDLSFTFPIELGKGVEEQPALSICYRPKLGFGVNEPHFELSVPDEESDQKLNKEFARVLSSLGLEEEPIKKREYTTG